VRNKNIDIKGIGIGQGGCNILLSGLKVRLFAKGIGINTTVSDLNALDLPSEYKVLCENPENPRRGAGKVPAKGRELVFSKADEIVTRIGTLFEGTKTDILMTIASLGGGTGTGGAFPVAYKLKEAFGKTVLGLFTLPEDSFTEERTATNVLIAVQELISKARDTYDSIIFIDNEKVLAQVKEQRVSMQEVNKRFLFPLAKVLEYIGRPCNYSFDVEDFEQLLLAGGCFAYFRAKVPEVTSEDALVTAVMESWQGDRHFPDDYGNIHQLSKTLGEQGKRIGGLGFLVAGPEHKLKYAIIQRAYDRLQFLVPTKLKFRGFVPDNSLGGVYITTMFSGLPMPAEKLAFYRECASQQKELAVTTDLDLLAGLEKETLAGAYALKSPKTKSTPISFGFEDMVPSKENVQKEDLFKGLETTPKRKQTSKWNI